MIAPFKRSRAGALYVWAIIIPCKITKNYSEVYEVLVRARRATILNDSDRGVDNGGMRGMHPPTSQGGGMACTIIPPGFGE